MAEKETDGKLVAILTRPDAQPLEVEITYADRESWKAFVQTPAGLEYYVSIDDLNCIEEVHPDGKRTFKGTPRRTDEMTPNYLVVKDKKEVLV